MGVVEVNWKKGLGFLTYTVIAIFLFYLLVLQPAIKEKKIKGRLRFCENQTGVNCSYYCYRGYDKTCMVLPDYVELDDKIFVSKMASGREIKK